MDKVNEMAFKGNSITIFDLDDTLVITRARIEVRDTVTGETFHLTPQEFNEYEHQPTHSVNYSQFEDPNILKAGELIEEILQELKNTYENETAVAIITARNKGEMIREFFLENGIDIHPKFVIAVNDPAEGFTGSVAEKKQQAIRRLYEMGYTDFRFFDDDSANLQLAKELESELPIRIETHQVVHAKPTIKKRKIGIFSGKFRPPHKGHYEAIKRMAAENDEVHVFVSKLTGNAKKPEDTMKGVAAENLIAVLDYYFEDFDNVQFHLAQVTPVRSGYEFLEDLGKGPDASEIIVNLYGTEEDLVRWQGAEKWMGGISKINRIATARPEFDGNSGESDADGVSGTIMRQFWNNGDLENFSQGVPEDKDPIKVWQLLGGTINESGEFSVPADSFDPPQDPNIMPTDVNIPVGGLPAHWTTTQPYSRFDLKTNPFAYRYGTNPKMKIVKSFEEFINQKEADK